MSGDRVQPVGSPNGAAETAPVNVAPAPTANGATPSAQSNGVDDTLRLPKFKKNQRQYDYTVHDQCCGKVPGRASDADASVLVRNSLGLCGFASVNSGMRDHMEDRHTIVYGRPDGLFRAFFGVFDGHGGEEASHYTHEHLSRLVTEEVEREYRAKAGLPDPAPVHDRTGQHFPVQNYTVAQDTLAGLQLDYKAALLRAFDRLEDEVLLQSRTVGCRDGTTVTSVLITHDTIYCANTGDSRTVLCRDNAAVALSTDHKPSSDDERARIQAAGGEVRAVLLPRAGFCCIKAENVPHGAERLWPGGFSVSRAVGDIDYKDLRRKKAKIVGVLIHRPDVSTTSCSPRDQFIVCGSDGLFDVMTNQQACDLVLKEMKKRKAGEPVADISQKLADHAYSLGSEDNITALVLYFSGNQLPFKQ